MIKCKGMKEEKKTKVNNPQDLKYSCTVTVQLRLNLPKTNLKDDEVSSMNLNIIQIPLAQVLRSGDQYNATFFSSHLRTEKKKQKYPRERNVQQ